MTIEQTGEYVNICAQYQCVHTCYELWSSIKYVFTQCEQYNGASHVFLQLIMEIAGDIKSGAALQLVAVQCAAGLSCGS